MIEDDSFLATQRRVSLFEDDWHASRDALGAVFGGASVLVVGGAGSIGAATVRRLLSLGVKRLHVADIDENGLARLARSVMAEGRPACEMFYLATDFGSYSMRAHVAAEGAFDVVLDFAAVKHVRSEKSLPALLHMLDVNVVKQDAFFRMLEAVAPPRRLFAVSTDKAADPANFMGATKRLLEELVRLAGTRSPATIAASARFANVAFSAGSLLESFGLRMAAAKPLAVPQATRRFFISTDEAAQICLLGSALCPPSLSIVPRPMPELPAAELSEVAARFVERGGRRPVFVQDFTQAELHLRSGAEGYPIVLTPLDTVGEKPEEVFVGRDEEEVDIGLRNLLAVRAPASNASLLDALLADLRGRVEGRVQTRSLDEIEAVIRGVIPNFSRSSGRLNLDDRV